MSKQLEGVKVGDKIKCKVLHGARHDLYTVTEVTKTLAKCKTGAAFRIDSGLLMGTGGNGRSWGRRYGYFAKPEDVERIKLEKRVRTAQSMLRNLIVTDENLVAVEALLKLESSP